MNNNKNIRKAYFASGCFWGTEYWFMKAIGVEATAVGFMGGNLDNPAYQQVKTGATGHLECVEVEDEKAIAAAYIRRLEEKGYKVATLLRPASTFWVAEDYHQQYYEHKGTQPYCHSYRKIF